MGRSFLQTASYNVAMFLAIAVAAISSLLAAPPVSKRSDHTDQLHGVSVSDPYRWMENADSPEVKSWIAEQSSYARQHLDKIPGRETLSKRLIELSSFNTYGRVVVRGKQVFYTRREPKANFPVIIVQENGGEPRVLIDPNRFERTAAISTWQPSNDGKYLAYGIAKAGSDWQEWKVREVASGKDLPDFIQWIKFSSPEWTADSKSFYYTRLPKPEGNMMTAQNLNRSVYLHRLGTAQDADELVFARPDDPKLAVFARETEDGRYRILQTRPGTSPNSTVAFQDMRKKSMPVEVVPQAEAEFQLIGTRGDIAYFRTTYKAPNRRVLAIDFTKPERANWKEIVPESKDTLEDARWTGGALVLQYLRHASTALRIHDLNGKLMREVKLPGLGTAHWSLSQQDSTEHFYTLSSFTSPDTVYRYDWKTGESKPFLVPDVKADLSQFETRQVFYPSKDGTRIPMFLTFRKGLQLNGNNPVLLTAYGGFRISRTPGFAMQTIAWAELGGIFATANIRGGGEYGEEWHKAGIRENRQRVFDDFIAAGEWLIANKYTQKSKLAITGGSNGGLLVGAVLNQRPDLYGAAIPAVGVMDMLRFHKFTIGYAWTSEYGTPDDPEDFKILMKYSPLHNVKIGTKYPPTMVTTADHDDRVVPAHSFKYAAAMQHAQEGSAPILIRIETDAGHGAGRPVSKVIESAADTLLFLKESLKM